MSAIEDVVEWLEWYRACYGRWPARLFLGDVVAFELYAEYSAMAGVADDPRTVVDRVCGVPLIRRPDIRGIMPEELLPRVIVVRWSTSTGG